MKYLLLCCAALLPAKALAQPHPAEKYAASITVAFLKTQLTAIASDEFEGRETGTDGQRKAAAYIESQFEKQRLLCGIDHFESITVGPIGQRVA